MGKTSIFARGIIAFYFDSFWAAFTESATWSLLIASALAILVPFALHLAKLLPSQEARLTSLIWQVPLVFFGSLFVMMLFYVPYSKYLKLERIASDNERTLKTEIAALNARLAEKDAILGDRKRRKEIREQLGRFLVEGDGLDWPPGFVPTPDQNRALGELISKIGLYLSTELDESYESRFVVDRFPALREFIKELCD